MIGFGRIGQLVAQRAQAFDMEVVAFDKFVAAERFRELGVEGVDSSEELYRRADLITIHLPKTPETIGWIDAEAISRMRDGVRIINCARGELIDLDALLAGLESGKVGGAALDVFPVGAVHRAPPVRARRRRRHARISAPRPPRRRTGPASSPPSRCARRSPVAWSPTPSTSPPCARRRWRRWRRSCPCARGSAAWPRGSATASIDRVEVDFHGRIAEHDTRLLGIAVLVGILSGHTEEPVNLVNAPAMAEDRGIELTEVKEAGVGGLHRADPRPPRRGRGRRHRRRAAQRPLPGRASGGRASTCRSPTTWRSSATPTSPG